MGMEIAAEAHKQKANELFQQHYYKEAIVEYSNAIIKNPDNPVYYTNRALAYLKLEQWEQVVGSCEKALELDKSSVKGHYFLGQALSELGIRLNESITLLKRAYSLGLDQKSSFIEDILTQFRIAKKKRWDVLEHKRREEQSDMYRYITSLINRDRARQLDQLTEKSGEALSEVNYAHDMRLSQMEQLFAQASENEKKRDIPDYMCGKISFEIMTDPVITPCGITYDRPELLTHLSKLGSFDPISRKPLYATSLIPNLAMKEVVDDFIAANGWAIDL